MKSNAALVCDARILTCDHPPRGRSEGPSSVSGIPLHSLTLSSVRPWSESRICAAALSPVLWLETLANAQLSYLGQEPLALLTDVREAKTNWRMLGRIKFKCTLLCWKRMFFGFLKGNFQVSFHSLWSLKFGFCSFLGHVFPCRFRTINKMERWVLLMVSFWVDLLLSPVHLAVNSSVHSSLFRHSFILLPKLLSSTW